MVRGLVLEELSEMTPEEQLLQAAAESRISIETFVAWNRLVCGRPLTARDIELLDATLIKFPSGHWGPVRA